MYSYSLAKLFQQHHEVVKSENWGMKIDFTRTDSQVCHEQIHQWNCITFVDSKLSRQK